MQSVGNFSIPDALGVSNCKGTFGLYCKCSGYRMEVSSGINVQGYAVMTTPLNISCVRSHIIARQNPHHCNLTDVLRLYLISMPYYLKGPGETILPVENVIRGLQSSLDPGMGECLLACLLGMNLLRSSQN